MKDIKLNMNSKFIDDMHVLIEVEGKRVPKGLFHLIQTQVQVGLFCEGEKPHSEFKLKDIKDYYLITGDRHAILKKINEIYNYFMDDEVKKTEL